MKVRSHRSDVPHSMIISVTYAARYDWEPMSTFARISEQLRPQEIFPYSWRQAYHWFWWQILFENQCSSLPSCNWSSLSLLLTKENEICKAVGCVAFLWWTLYTGFKLFCLGYREMEFIWQPQETGPHLIACNEIHPLETLPCAVSICCCP